MINLHTIFVSLTRSQFAGLPSPVWAAVKWSGITIAAVAVIPLLLLSTSKAPVVAGTRVEPARSLSLMLTGEGGRLILGWDRETPAIRSGRCGLLWVTDGDIRRRVVLDTSQLRAGKLFYWPVNQDVSFELKMFDGNSRAGEPECGNNLRSVMRLAENPARLPASRNRLSPVRITWHLRLESPHPEDESSFRKFAPVESRKAPFTIEMPEPPPVAILPVQTVMESPILAAASSPVLRAAPEPFPTVRVEAAAEPRSGRAVVNRVTRGRLRRPTEFLPPKPTRKTTPAVPEDLSRTLKGEVLLDVRVYINKSGKVDYAEMLSDITRENRDLAGLAVFDARHWEFIPARLAGQVVPAQVVLHYRYGNTLLAVSRVGR